MKLKMDYETITENQIPVTTCYPEDGKNLPLVLLNHGTSGNWQHMFDMGFKLALDGYFCVMIDARQHGRRLVENFWELYGNPKLYKANYLQMLLDMSSDMSCLIDYYEKDERVDASRVAMTGISQGGYVAFMTITQDKRVTVAAPLIGSPDLEDKYGSSPDFDELDEQTKARVIKYSPLRNYEKMYPVKLLVQSCEADTVVPIGGTERLNEKLKPLYKNNPDDYKFITYPGLGHEAPYEMQQKAIDWIKEKL